MIRPIPLQSVRLLDGPIQDRQSLNSRYLLELDLDRLLHNFRVNAGFPSQARPLGGWESPSCGLRGHFTGHYLSACAHTIASTGDERFRDRVNSIVAEFTRCQAALGGGYLSAFPESEFERLEQSGVGIWAPYYTLHKILAGLLDADRSESLEIAARLGDWIARRLDRLSPEAIEKMLRTDQINPSNEYGGIGRSLYDLYSRTRNPSHLNAAKTFDRSWFVDPLIEGRDELSGLHANTHIPQALALVARFTATGEERFLRAAEFFWRRTAQSRSYVNGGSSGPRPDRTERSEGGEHWPHAEQLAGTLTPKINESCVAHNMIRLTDDLARHFPENQTLAEFRERAFFNSVLPMQHPGHCGCYLYSHPLSPSSRKVYGDFDNTFWCCYGTSVDAFACLGDGIYFADDSTIHIQQFVASEVVWKEKGVRLTQNTDFPQHAQTKITVHADSPAEFAISVRIPSWTTAPTCRLNGEEIDLSQKRSLHLSRTWRDGDTVELSFPMSIHTESLPGDPSTIAFLYGPIVLAARTAHGLELNVPPDQAASLVRQSDPDQLEFQVRLSFGNEVPLVPLKKIVDEPYGVYFKTARI